MAASLSEQQRDVDTLQRQVFRKVAWRLIPFLGLLYLLNILERINVGFARITMLDDLGMSARSFDILSGMFYVGYILFEVPSNLLLRRMGARRWIARIVITWGLVSCAMMAVQGPWSFVGLRFLLGVAEAGFFPGIVLYLTYWFPAKERGRVMAFFMIASPLAGVVGNPLSGAIMELLEGTGGLAGWRWLLFLEGVPSVLAGLAVFCCLTDYPRQAAWLTDEERSWLVERMAQEDQYRQQRHGADFRRALADGRVWLLIAVYLTVAIGANAAGLYFPQFIKDRFVGLRPLQIGLLGALPSLCTVVAMMVFGIHSDRTGERRKHLAFVAFLGAAGWMLSYLTALFNLSPWLFLAGMCLAQMGMSSMLPIFWALPTSFLSGAAAAGGIALINSFGNAGAIVGASILGLFGPLSMALILLVGAMLALRVRHDSTLDRGLPAKASA